MNIDTILVPVDCTNRSTPLMRHAALLAGQLDARLVFVHVYELPQYVPACMHPEDFDRFHLAMHQQAQTTLESLQQSCDDDPKIRSAQLVAVYGFFEETIFDVAKKVGADLIVISTHGYSGFKRFFHISNAVRVVHHILCPVLIIPDAQLVQLEPREKYRHSAC